jgi:hypothetical protein
MRSQLVQRTIDYRHADHLAVVFALLEHLDRDRLGVGTRSVRAGVHRE